MINMIRHTTTTEQILEAAPFTFYLTGSLYFKGYGNDIDYFAAWSPKIVEFLSKHPPFSRTIIHDYLDTQCLEIWQAPNIHIQLVRDAQHKMRVQTKLKTLGYSSPTTEEWNLAFLLIS